MTDDNTEKVAELEGQVSDLQDQLEKLSKQLEAATAGNAELAKAAELQGQLDEALTKLDEVTTALESTLAEKKAAEDALKIEKQMTADEKDYCQGMSADEKSAFMAKPPEERKKEMNKRAEGDETVTVEGQTIKKSAVGEAQFAIIKAQAERIAKSEKAIADEIEKREVAEFTKRADEAYKHVPGSVEERANVLRHISKLENEELRKSLDAILESAEKLAKAGFAKLGAKGGKPEDQNLEKQAREFMSKVDNIRRDFPKMTRQEALSKARRDNPELFKAYQDQQGN